MIYIFTALRQEVCWPKEARKKILSSRHLYLSHDLSKTQVYYLSFSKGSKHTSPTVTQTLLAKYQSVLP